MTTPKNLVCLWYNHDAEDAANFYAATFPDTRVTASTARPPTTPTARPAT